MLSRILQVFNKYIWHSDLHSMPWHKRMPIFWVRMLQLLIQDFMTGEITLRATGLVYTTLLSIVPLLAFVFAILKALGIQESLKPFLFEFLSPLGEKGGEISMKIMHFVDNVKVGLLGTIGLLVLLYAVISLVQKVESGLNYIWRVREEITLSERFSHYLGVLVIGPVLLVSALAITATINSPSMTQHILQIIPLGHLVVIGIKLLPYLLVIIAFTFTYAFVPHTHVQFRAALAGGVFAGVLWQFASWAFAALTVSSTRLTIVYSGFAILVMFMAWVYLCWLILFVGAQVAFYVQNPELVRHGHGHEDVGGRTLERLALHVMYLIGRCYHDNKQPWSREDLARRLRVPTDTILDVLGRLRETGLVMLVSGGVRRYVPARDMGTIKLLDIINAMRLNPPGAEDLGRYLNAVGSVDEVMNKLDHAIEGVLGDTTLRSLVEQQAVVDIADLRRA
ncbi:MAG: YhjD/YihY/BrkB family envelope integrity protein [Gammaproteobacteria bacterium]